LADKDPGNTQSQDDLAKSHSLVGELLLEAGEKKAALKEYQEALRIREELTRANTSAVALQYSLALAHADAATTSSGYRGLTKRQSRRGMLCAS